MTGIRLRVVFAWTVAMLLAGSFVIQAGLPKLLGSPGLVAAFAGFGYPPWFVRAIGLVETAGGLLVLVPSLAAYGAALLAVDMLGAIYTHLSSGIGSPSSAALMLALAGLLIALRAREARGLRPR